MTHTAALILAMVKVNGVNFTMEVDTDALSPISEATYHQFMAIRSATVATNGEGTEQGVPEGA